MLHQLAIFQHFYNIDYETALNFPLWKWESLLEQREKIIAESDANQIMAVNSGFSGNDEYRQKLVKFANPIKHRKRNLPKNASFRDIYGFSP